MSPGNVYISIDFYAFPLETHCRYVKNQKSFEAIGLEWDSRSREPENQKVANCRYVTLSKTKKPSRKPKKPKKPKFETLAHPRALD